MNPRALSLLIALFLCTTTLGCNQVAILDGDDGGGGDALHSAGKAYGRRDLEYGFNTGKMALTFDIDPGGTVSIRPAAQLALNQIYQDGFRRVAIMEPFMRNFLPDWPNRPVAAIKLLQDQGFTVLLTINGSPFYNDDTQHPEDQWVYRFFPGNDPVGTDDDRGLPEHKRRMTEFMMALHHANAIGPQLDFEVFDEPNADRSFWGTFAEFETLLAANLEIIGAQKFGVRPSQIRTSAVTSKLMLADPAVLATKNDYFLYASGFQQNPTVNAYSFSFNWYPVSSVGNFTAADIAIQPVYAGSWITGTNVSASMNIANLAANRANNTFVTKMNDIIFYAKYHRLAGLYFFKLLNESDVPAPGTTKLELGFFDTTGCPRYEYLQLLQMLGRPIQFGACAVPTASGL